MIANNEIISDSFKTWQTNLEENLQNVTSYCPHAIAKESEESRNRRLLYEDLLVFELNNDRSLVLKDPVVDEFINLDTHIKINSEEPKIKAFGETIQTFVEILCNLLETTNSYYKFKVYPCGSFPLNTKICCINEFDFRLEWLDQVFNYPPISNSNVVAVDYLTDEIYEIYETLENIIQNNCSLFEKCKISMVEFIKKRCAMTIIMLWLCPLNGHQHEVSIDLAICLKTNLTVGNFLAQKNPFKNTIFNDSLKKNAMVYINFAMTRPSVVVDSNSFDQDLFRTCDMISPNIKSCFRILKYLRDMIFPYRYKRKSGDTFYLESAISSYKLKILLLKEVVKFPSAQDWNISTLYLRIKSLLSNLQKAIEQFGFNTFFDGVADIKEEKLLHKILKDLIWWMENDCPKVNVSVRWLEKRGIETYIYGKVLLKIKDRNCQHPYLAGNDKVRSLIKPKLVDDSNISRWLCKKYHGIINSMIQIDLTNLSDSEANQIMCMVIHKLINENDVESGMYVEKVKMLSKVLEAFGATLRDAFSSNDECYEVTGTRLVKVLSLIYNQTALIESADIYRYLKHGTKFDGMENSTSLSEVTNVFETAMKITKAKDEYWLAAALRAIEFITGEVAVPM